ncbi:MAG: hypothetical protein P4M14_04545 [Gammaproteobacteria bacterium]|nr:hypothetical protein [Gammaproteobacteria bacterium]
MLERESKSDSINEFFANLPALYRGNDANCIKVISFIQEIAKKMQGQRSKKALYGLAILAYSLLEDRSYLSQVLANRFSFFRDDSLQLAATFKKQSGIFEDGIENEEMKLIYLTALLQHVKKHEAKVSYVFNKEDKTLSQIIECLIQPILSAAKTASDIKILTHKRPNAEALQKTFASIPATYLEIKKEKANRKEYLAIIEIMAALCQTNHLDQSLIPIDEKKMPLGYLARFATLLYIMTEQEAEFTFRSVLYDQCKSALNIDHSSEILASEKTAYYLALRSCMPKTESPSAWKSPELQAAKPLFIQMEKKLKEHMSAPDRSISMDEPHPYIARFSYLVETAAQFGITLGLGYMSGTLAQKVISKTVINATSGVIVYGLMRAEGLVASQVETVLEKNVLPAALNRSIGYATGLMGSAMDISISGTVYMVLKLPTEGIEALLAFCTALRQQGVKLAAYNNPEWAQSLLALPDDLVNKSIKDRILNTHVVDVELEDLTEIPNAAASFTKAGP